MHESHPDTEGVRDLPWSGTGKTKGAVKGGHARGWMSAGPAFGGPEGRATLARAI
jgi:hypothetical protein